MTDSSFPIPSEATIADVQNLFQSGELTVSALVEAYLGRIAALDQGGPLVNSIIELNPDAEAMATEMDAELTAGQPRGPLHGIPILLKDNVDTGDQMQTTAGSLALEGNPAPADSAVAARLRAAGALILGKTNLSEWANFRSTSSVSGWSSRGGQTRNPFALDRSPSGSSSGSGAAVAANFCLGAIGSETDGSIVSPSSANGIVGFKPTVGLVSRRGIVPISATQDTAGPMTRSVADAALMLEALAGKDAADAASEHIPADLNTRFREYLNPNALKGVRIGVVRHYFGKHPLEDQMMEEALATMSRLGAIIIDPVKIDTMGGWREAEFEVMLYEFKAGLNRYFQSRGGTASITTLAELIEFNNARPLLTMPIFGQEILQMAVEKGDLNTPAYLEALATCRETALEKGINAALHEHDLDVLVGPTRGPAWLVDPVNGDCSKSGSSGLAAVAGTPHLTVPLGLVHSLPVNLSFMGAAWADGPLLGVGYAFEQATQARQDPQFLPAARLSL
ncbi:MAG: amidase [Ardenticatenaceae bacterium]|nr:amidase [Ardenticatenaceae bacterium]